MTSWPTYEKAPAVAFIDVDGTLLAETTTFLFAKVLRRRGLIGRSFLLRAAYHGLQHKLGRLDYGRLVAYGLKEIAGIPIVDLERIAYENFKDDVKPRLYEGVVDHFNDLRRAGTDLVLVTSSPAIVVQPLALYLGCADTLTTPVKVDRGRLVGVGEGPPCYGEGKLYWARQWAAGRGIDLAAAAAYADNWSDRALLGEVGHAVAVRPHRMLRKLAHRRGWTIVSPPRPAGKATRHPASR